MPASPRLVSKTISLLKQIQKDYSTAEAERIWTNIENAIDNVDLKMEVFKRLLSGSTHVDEVIITRWTATGNNAIAGGKVQAIKLIRNLSGLGLKEAKDMVEAAAEGRQQTFKLMIKRDEDGAILDHDFRRAEADLSEANFEFEMY
jgi:hypothetical protein